VTSEVDKKENASLRPPLADQLSFVISSKQRDFAQVFIDLLLLGVQHVGDFNVVFRHNLAKLFMVAFGCWQV
jgi:hypothetical protein